MLNFPFLLCSLLLFRPIIYFFPFTSFLFPSFLLFSLFFPTSLTHFPFYQRFPIILRLIISSFSSHFFPPSPLYTGDREQRIESASGLSASLPNNSSFLREDSETYHPWGKPGAGAPRRDGQGQLIHRKMRVPTGDQRLRLETKKSFLKGMDNFNWLMYSEGQIN